VATWVHPPPPAAFDNVSLDLLYDVPGQTTTTWQATLAAALALEPEHVSAYALSLDDPAAEGLTGIDGDHQPPSVGARRWRERASPEQDEDFAAACYEMADDALSSAGLGWYEISNWARPGRQSHHNLAYWLGDAYEAVGPGAHAFDGGRRRRWNGARLDRYLAALLPIDGSPASLPPGGMQTVEATTAAADRAILRLRTSVGLPPTEASRPALRDALEWGRANGLLEVANGAWQLTRRGRLLSTELFVRV
jgi:coproporphyrinogen III oxidase-like Fe-S oxidoreductase